jgi:hypothetical protein
MIKRASFVALTMLSLQACFDGTVIEPFGTGAGGEGAQGAGGNACASCDDGNPCTEDLCDADGSCLHPPAAVFTLMQVDGDCQEAVCEGTVLSSDADDTDLPIDDGNPCTEALCKDGQPSHPAVQDGTACNDSGVCNAGLCSTCVEDADCGNPIACASFECGEAGGCQLVPQPKGLVVPGGMPEDCQNVVCDGLGATVVGNDDADVPASDSNPCTQEACLNGTPTHDPKGPGTVPPENGVACNGACQAGVYAGTCGLRIFQRTFPAAGAWSSSALSDGPSPWQAPGAPPPNSITVAEETSDGSRLMVVRQPANQQSTYYEFINGAWQSTPLTSVPGLEQQPALSALGSGRYIRNELVNGSRVAVERELAAFVGSTNPLTAYAYIVPPVGTLVLEASFVIPVPMQKNPNLCPQYQFPILWAFNEQRSVPAGDPPPRTWKFCNGLVYVENNNDFNPIGQPTTEAASPLQITGNNGSPIPGTILAAYYRKSVNTVFMIAP